MRIVVCVKPRDGEVNPFDACAVETALRLKDERTDVRVTAVSMNRRDGEEPLRDLTRRGVSESILLTDPAFAGADTLATAYTLSLAMNRLHPDLILCGRQSTDGDTAQTGPMLAAMLGMPVLTHVLELHLEGGVARCVTRLGEESVRLPCVLTMERLYPLRFPRIGSKAKTVESWDREILGADPSRCGLKGSPTRVVKSEECRTGRRHCRYLPLEQLEATIEAARERPPEETTGDTADGPTLPEVWAVGMEPPAMVRKIARRIRRVPRGEPEELAGTIRRENPEVVLWDGGLWGRRVAPQTAAMLKTGLCADCTALETDGKTLTMIRPAFGGGILAHIICRTTPVMATVRGDGDTECDVVVGVGAGAARQLPRIREWANRRGYSLAASRALVDLGLAPYEWQVGLTGRTVAPKVYVAIGISGAVQHTCAIEQAKTVIAVNPDKQARIFEYADFGICDVFR